MTIDSFYEQLKLIENVFRSQIVTTNFEKTSPYEISWLNYKSGIFKNIYAKEYEYIIKNRQYSFLLSDDKGCVQFYFYSKDAKIEKVKMAYYPYPVELKENKDDYENMLSDTDDEILMEYYYDLWNIFNHNFELNINDENLKKLVADSISHGNDESIENLLLGKFEYKYSATNSSHLRIDYDANVASHNKCEVQIGAINNIRFPMKELISPFIFFEFIFKNLFIGEYHKIKNNSTYSSVFNNAKKVSFKINPFNELNIYLKHD